MERDIIKDLDTWGNSTTRKPLILSGTRQVGKTHILKEYGEKFFNKCHYINFEKQKNYKKIFHTDLNANRILGELELALKTKIEIGKDLIIFDEIQECPEALTALKYFHEDMPEQHLASAGSLLGVTLSGESFPVGKVDRLWMSPMSFSEFLRGIDREKEYHLLKQGVTHRKISSFVHESLLESYQLFSALGGMPAVINAFKNFPNNLKDGLDSARQTQLTLLKDYIDDIGKHSGKVNALHIRTVFDNIPVQLGQTLESGARKFIFKDVIPSKKGYAELHGPIEWLEKAGLIYRIKICNHPELPLEAFCKESAFKVYFFDTGLLGAHFELAIETLYQQNYGQTKGVFAENLALQLLKTAQGSNISENIIYSWQKNTSEIEFLLAKNNQVIPIEVKAGTNFKAKSLRSYINRYSPKISLILSNKEMSIDNGQNVWTIPTYCSEYLYQLLNSSYFTDLG